MNNENQNGAVSCSAMCWLIGALLGLATYLVLSGRFEMGMVVALIVALVVVLAAALLFGRLFCQGPPSEIRHPARHDHDIAATRESVAKVDSIGGGDLAMAPSVPELANEKPSAPKADDGSNVKRAPNFAKRPVTRAKMMGSTKKPATNAAPKSKAKVASKTNAKAATSDTSDTKPEMLTKARAGGADDLKQIKGVGPKLEQMLNEMGIYHFDQVSGWSADEVKWADENIKGVKGRVLRDEWVKQAKILTAGGVTEFSKKVKKGGVYDKNKK